MWESGLIGQKSEPQLERQGLREVVSDLVKSDFRGMGRAKRCPEQVSDPAPHHSSRTNPQMLPFPWPLSFYLPLSPFNDSEVRGSLVYSRRTVLSIITTIYLHNISSPPPKHPTPMSCHSPLPLSPAPSNH